MAVHKLTERVLVDDINNSLINNGQVDYGNKTQVEITALTGVVTGSLVYNTTTNKQQLYNGTNWIDFALITDVTASVAQVKFVNQSGNVTAGNLANTIYYYSFIALGELTLPTAIGNTSVYTVKNNSNVNITVVFTGGENADGTTSISFVPNQSLTFISNNTNYNIN